LVHRRGGIAAGIWRTSHALRKISGRQGPAACAQQPDHEDYSFLNAVGAVWSADIDKSAAGYMASTGFLIDRCHVLTNMHAVYTDDVVVNPPVGKPVSFAVGQTEGAANRGALQGLKFLLSGVGRCARRHHHRRSPRAQSGKRLGADPAGGKCGRLHQADDHRAVDGAQLPKIGGFRSRVSSRSAERRGDRSI
jgi:hypothetical protein